MNWTNWKNTHDWLLQNKFNFFIYSAVFFTCHFLKDVVRVIQCKIINIENDLTGYENWFELAGGSRYRGFELPRVKLQ